jgi:integrase
VLTDRALQMLKPAPAGQRYEVRDDVVPGLAVRVTDKGRRTFVLIARYPGSPNPTRRALGGYGALSLAGARDKARAWHELLAKGVDPAADAERRQLEAQRQERRRHATSFSAVAESFIDAITAQGQRKADIVARELRAEFISRFGARPIAEIEPADIKAVIREAVQRGATYQAHNLLGHVRRLFNWAIAEDEYGLERSPCDRLKPKDLIGAKKPRQRTLTDDELFAFWRAAGRLGYPFGPLFRLLAVTGQRKMEVGGARWQEFHPELVRLIRAHDRKREPIAWHKIDNAIKLWEVPPERFKSDASHLVPLTDEACRILEALPCFREGDHLFSTTLGEKPVNGYSKAKARLDRHMRAILRALARKRRDDPSKVELRPFIVHDVRRSVRTRLSGLRVPDTVAEQVIGHGRRGIQRVYDQHQCLEEMREALSLWAGRLRSVVEPAPANVVALRAGEGGE